MAATEARQAPLQGYLASASQLLTKVRSACVEANVSIPARTRLSTERVCALRVPSRPYRGRMTPPLTGSGGFTTVAGAVPPSRTT
jgi:hypothetical protein